MQVNAIPQSPLSPSPPEKSVQVNRFHIPTLDGFRAIAFLLVFVAHSGLGHLFPGGAFGVTIFFFLSGYLITTLLRQEYEKKQRIALKRWYLKRVLRILPLLYLAILLGSLVTQAGLLPETWATLDPASLISQVLHWSNYWMIENGENAVMSGTSVLWSLAVEIHFYLLFPLLFLLLQKGKLSQSQQAGVIWGLCALILLWRCILVLGLNAPELRTYMGSDTRVDGILFGVALALKHNPALDPPLGRDRQWLWFGLPAALTILASTLLVRDPAFRETLRYSLQSLALYPIFMAAIRCSQSPIFSWLEHPWLRFLGRLSYPLYLTHYVLILLLLKSLPTVPIAVLAIVALGLSIGLSFLLDQVLEQPVQKLRQTIQSAV